MTITLYNLFEAALLCVNAIAVLHEERFLSKIGWGSADHVRGFGEEPGIKSQIIQLIRSVRTVMRNVNENMPSNLFISTYGIIFRAKLISKFKLLDYVTKNGERVNTLLSSSKLNTPEGISKIRENDDQVFVDSELDQSIYKPQEIGKEIFGKPRHVRNMVKPTRLQKASLFAHKVNNNKYYQYFMLVVLVLFCLMMGLNVECVYHLEDNIFTNLYWFSLGFIYLCLPVFLLDPILGYLEDKIRFWMNGWYILDCIMNVMGILSCVGLLSAIEPKWFFWHLHVFQVLRAIKIIRLIPVVNLLVKAIHQAVKDMLFVLLTLLLVIFVFALAGMVMFAHYEESGQPNLKFADSFSGFGNAIKTLFNIYTFDTWPKRFREIKRIFGPAGGAWIILWVCVGGYIIKSIFDGVFIYKFQESHQAILQETEMEMDREEDENRLKEFISRLEQENDFLKKLQSPPENCTEEEYKKMTSDMLNLCYTHELSWNKFVKLHLAALDRWHSETIWPKDTLFSYLQAMEALMENLAEREKLFRLLVEALLSIHDVNVNPGRNLKS